MRPNERRPLGGSGVRVTQLGLGAAALGGLFSPVEEPSAVATVAAALDSGIAYLDTAPLYGHGRSELRVGAALAGRERDSYVLSTKVGRLLEPCDGGVQSEHFADPLPHRLVWDFSRRGVERSLEESLERLQLERVDVALIHDPDVHFRWALDHAYPALARMRDAKTVSAIGFGMNQTQMLARFARETDCDCLLVAGRYTLLDQSAAEELLPECEKRGIGVIIGGPYNSGVLASWPAPGHYDYGETPRAQRDKTARIAEVCVEHGVPLRAAALQFPFGHSAVVSTIPGARSTDEVYDNLAMFSQRIPDGLWEQLRAEGLIAPGAPTPTGCGGAA